MVFVEHDPVGIKLAVQQFLQEVSVGLKEDACPGALAAVLPELVTDGLSAGLFVEPGGKLRERKSRDAARLQHDDAPLAVPA